MQRDRTTLERPSSSLRRDFSWTLLGLLVYNACQWLILVLVARSTSPRDLGELGLAISICAPVLMFLNALRQLQVAEAEPLPLAAHLRVRRVSAALLFGGILVLVGSTTESALFLTLTFLVALTRFTDTISDAYWGHFQRASALDRIGISLSIKGVVSLALATLVVLFMDVRVAAFGMLVGSATSLVLYDRKNVPSTDRSRDSRVPFLRVWKVGLPLAMAALFNSLGTNIPRYVLVQLSGPALVGNFVALSHLLVGAHLTINAVCQAALPRLVQAVESQNHSAYLHVLLRLLATSIALAVAGIIIASIAGEFLLGLIYGDEYKKLASTLVWLMIAAFAAYLSSISSFVATSLRMFNQQPFVFAGSSLVALGGAYWLIPLHGLNGAVWAYGGSLFFQALALSLLGFWKWRRMTRLASGASNPS